MNVELVTAFYGSTYADMVNRTLVPSLWQDSNIPAMIRSGHSITHRIYCPSADAERIMPHPVDMEFNTSILTGDGQDRGRLYLCFQDAIRRHCLTIMAIPDAAFGLGLWSVVRALKPGQILVCGHPRISREDGVAAMAELIALKPSDNRHFVKMCMDGVAHPMVLHGMTHPEPYWRTTRRTDHWETFFKEPAPIAFWGSDEMLDAWKSPTVGTLEVIDHDLVNLCYKRGTLLAITDSREFFWAEFTSKNDYLPTIYNEIWLESCKHFNRTPCRWYFA